MISLLVALLTPPGDTTLTLSQALSLALARRGAVQSAAAIAREARASERAATRIPNPILMYSHTEDTPRQHLSVDQPLSWLVTRGRQRGVARSGTARARLDSARTVSTTAQEVRRAFFAALGALQFHQITLELRQVADSLLHLGRLRFEAGDIARLELDQIEQDARRQRQSTAQARQALDASIVALVQATGWVGSAPRPVGTLEDGLDDPIPTLTEEPISVRIAELDSTAAHGSVRLARSSAIPMPSLEIGADWDDPAEPGKALSVIGFSIPFPIWHRNRADIAVAKARADQASGVLSETRANAIRLANEALLTIRSAGERARFARDTLLPAARSLRDRALAAYREGETGLLPVLEALRSERELMLEAIDDLVLYQQARADWLELIGSAQ